ncbi:MAG: hypothetical protein HQK60_18185 [Deltaproteobacteria bacterium]|nr:hypothetical protein [Deltaproteobacteria bacterium]
MTSYLQRVTVTMHPRPRIYVLPLGEEIGKDVIEIIAANLQVNFSLPAAIMAPQPLPDETYNAHRDQYNALSILKFIQSLPPPPEAKLLAVVNADLFIPILTHVFGEAQLDQAGAVVSLWRISRVNDGGAAPLPLFYERAAKLAVHELAHTFNLSHCLEPNCLLNYLPDLDSLDAQPLIFCRYCQMFLEEKIAKLFPRITSTETP